MTTSPTPFWKRGLRDRDTTETTNRGMLLVFGVVGVLALFYAPLPLAVMVLAVPIVVPIIQKLSGRLARTIYDPSGSTVASRPGYSAAESLAVRGRFEEAIRAYETAAVEEPDDPEPCLRIARIERMDLKRPQRALEALRAARGRAEPGSKTMMMIGREIVEILLRDMNDPSRAMPELARLAATHPGTPIGTWAARELAELKAGRG